jgi:hypothetical protein
MIPLDSHLDLCYELLREFSPLRNLPCASREYNLNASPPEEVRP